jgi:hypothetical protein
MDSMEKANVPSGSQGYLRMPLMQETESSMRQLTLADGSKSASKQPVHNASPSEDPFFEPDTAASHDLRSREYSLAAPPPARVARIPEASPTLGRSSGRVRRPAASEHVVAGSSQGRQLAPYLQVPQVMHQTQAATPPEKKKLFGPHGIFQFYPFELQLRIAQEARMMDQLVQDFHDSQPRYAQDAPMTTSAPRSTLRPEAKSFVPAPPQVDQEPEVEQATADGAQSTPWPEAMSFFPAPRQLDFKSGWAFQKEKKESRVIKFLREQGKME